MEGAPNERKGIKAAQRADQHGALLRLFESGLYQPLRHCWIRRIREPVSHTGALICYAAILASTKQQRTCCLDAIPKSEREK